MPTVTDILNTAAPIATAIQALGGTIIEVTATVVPDDISGLDTPIARIAADLRNTTAPQLSEIGEAIGASVQWAISENHDGGDAVILRKDDTLIHVGQAVAPGQYLIPAIDILAAAQLIASLGSVDTLRAFVVEYEDSEYDDDEDTSVHIHVVPADGTDSGVFEPTWLGIDEIRVTVKDSLPA